MERKYVLQIKNKVSKGFNRGFFIFGSADPEYIGYYEAEIKERIGGRNGRPTIYPVYLHDCDVNGELVDYGRSFKEALTIAHSLVLQLARRLGQEWNTPVEDCTRFSKESKLASKATST